MFILYAVFSGFLHWVWRRGVCFAFTVHHLSLFLIHFRWSFIHSLYLFFPPLPHRFIAIVGCCSLGAEFRFWGGLMLLLPTEKFFTVIIRIRYSRVTGKKGERRLQKEDPPLWKEQGFSNTVDIERLGGNQEEAPAGSQETWCFFQHIYLSFSTILI